MRLRNWCKSRRIPKAAVSRRNAAIRGPNTSIIRGSEGTSNTPEMILEPSQQAKEANRTGVWCTIIPLLSRSPDTAGYKLQRRPCCLAHALGRFGGLASPSADRREVKLWLNFQR